MLKKLLFALCFTTSLSQAQNVNFPDANFKALLVGTSPANISHPCKAFNSSDEIMAIDANDDGEIQMSEALSVKKLLIGNSNQILQISSLGGLEGFSNINYLEIKYLNIITLNISSFNLLENLSIIGSPLLTDLNINNNLLLQTVLLSSLPQLSQTYCNNNNVLATLTLQGLPALVNLDCSANNISSLNLAGAVNLKYLQCGQNQIAELNCTSNIHLEQIWCEENNMTSLLRTSLPELAALGVYSNNFTSLDLSGLPSLGLLDCQLNALTSLDLTALPALSWMYCNNNSLTTLDISHNPLLIKVWAQDNAITYANLKNAAYFDQLNFQGNPLQLVCLEEKDEFYFEYMQGEFSQMGLPGVVISAFCSFGPGGGYNTITGNVRYDAAANGCGPDDNGIPYARVRVSNGTISKSYFTGVGGSYTAYAGEGTYSITCDNEGGLFNVSPGAQPVNFTGGGQSADKSFCISSDIMTEDKQVLLAPLTSAQPGFDAQYQLIYRNMGSAGSASGTIVLSYDDSVIDFISAVPAPDMAVGGMLTWNYSSLAAFESRTIQLTVNLNSPAEIPSLNLNDVLQYNVNITSPATDANPANNNFYFEQMVTGSFDPNDIACLQGSNVSDELIGTPLYYNINFENTGNAPATFIVVEDQFNPDQYNIGTFQMISASHPVRVKTEGHTVTFRFDNINLGPNQKGNVVFRIASSEDLMTGDSVSNKANIFFDYNLPIETNVATTTFQVLGNKDFATNSANIYPNPTNGIVNINSASAIQKVEVYDIQGRLLHTQDGASQKLDLSGRAKGIYFIKIANANGIKTEKIVLE